MMSKLPHLTTTFMLLICLMTAVPAGYSASSTSTPNTPNKQQLYLMLLDNKHEAVLNLARGEREILLGMLNLERGNTKAAIDLLNSPAAAQDPLAALIRAEAYRRQSVKAAERAGTYAHSVNGSINTLKNAKLNTGLIRAELRMQSFIKSLDNPDRAKPQPAAVQLEAADPAQLDGLHVDIEQWRKDWQSLNADAYLSHYHRNFKTLKHDLSSWSQYKRRVNGRKSYIRITISNLNIIRTVELPHSDTAVVIEFDQNYISSNYTAKGRKQLYLVRNQQTEQWQILFEGEPGQRVPSFSSLQVSVNNSAILKAAPAKTNRPLPTPASVKTDGNWAINLGSFDSRKNAEDMAKDINVPPGEKQPFVSAVFNQGRVVHRVRIGLFSTRSAAVSTMLEACPALGLTDCWLEQLENR